MQFMNIADGHEQPIPAAGNQPRQCHVFDADSIAAIDAALAAQRPLLLRGEPGIGKSQLAQAAALVLRRAYVPSVVDAGTESNARARGQVLQSNICLCRAGIQQCVIARPDPIRLLTPSAS
jgi:hypothetical protein